MGVSSLPLFLDSSVEENNRPRNSAEESKEADESSHLSSVHSGGQESSRKDGMNSTILRSIIVPQLNFLFYRRRAI